MRNTMPKTGWTSKTGCADAAGGSADGTEPGHSGRRRRSLARIAIVAALAVAGLGGGVRTAQAQTGGTGVIQGAVRDSSRAPVPGADVKVLGTSIQTITASDGSYRLVNVPAGTRVVVAGRFGYAADSMRVAVAAGTTAVRGFTLPPAPVRLAGVVVEASPRMAETKAAALTLQFNASNIVSTLSGDEIRSLPNFNAAEAAGRIPGVSLERDEGEGKFVQVRGTSPRLSNVTIDGVQIPGTEADRIPKLDDVPSDLLAAISVSKTLTADMEADAIGGTVRLQTKTPEGAPRGYLAGQWGQMDLAGRTTYQAGFTYGGRYGDQGKLGFLIGASADRNNRGIDDVEPAWADVSGFAAPNEWSMRDYRYGRKRYGVGGDLDYRFNPGSRVYVKGLWSDFLNNGSVYINDIAGDPTPAGAGNGTIPDAAITRTAESRAPHEHMWALTAGATQGAGRWTLDYALDLSGTSQSSAFRFADFGYTGAPMTLGYTAPGSSFYPKFQFQSAADSMAAADPANFALSDIYQSLHTTTGRDVGGDVNALLHYALGDNASQFKVGARIRHERKVFTQQSVALVDTSATPGMSTFLSSFSDPGFYSAFARGYVIGPVPSYSEVLAYEGQNAGSFINVIAPSSDTLSSFGGTEQVTAGYAMNTTDIGKLRVNAGLRVEATHATYTGHALTTDSAGNTTGVQDISGTKNYTDLFPSVQLRYAVDPRTNVRLALTRGIARPNYPDLAPNQSGMICPTCANQPSLSGFSTGNPNLKAQYAWNVDLLFAHYLRTVGEISGGLFYKDLKDVILSRRITYTGPGPFHGYQGYAPDNGGGGTLWGFEAVWTQRFVSLPGFFAGLGIDANWTHTDSKVLVDPQTGREAPLRRQSPNIANLYVTYDKSPFSARIGWTYNGPMIDSYGDGTPTPNGDTYFYAHGQVDGSIVYNATHNVQIQVEALNINNAPFGFFMGTPGHEFNIQREYYQPTFFLGTKIGF
jgi:TonB-dependent receptor